MALENKIIVRFQPQGDKKLITAINHLNVATKGLKTSSSAYEKALKGLTNAQKAQVDSMLKLNHGARQTSGSFSSLRSQLLLASFAMAIVTGTAIKLAKSFGVQQQAVMKLNMYVQRDVLKNLKSWASELQNITGIGDEVTIAEMSKVAALTNSEQSIKKATMLAADYAAKYNTDLPSAMDKVVQTMGSTRNAFNQTGLMTEEAKDALLGAGTAVEKLDILFAALNPKIGGMAKEMGGTFTAQLNKASGALGDMGEIIGEALVPIIIVFTTVIRVIAAILGALPKGIIIPVLTAFAALATVLGVMKVATMAAALATEIYAGALVLLGTVAAPVTKTILAVTAVVTGALYYMGLLGDNTSDAAAQMEVINQKVNQGNAAYTKWLVDRKKGVLLDKDRNKVMSEQLKVTIKQIEIDMKEAVIHGSLAAKTISLSEAKKQRLSLSIEQKAVDESQFVLDQKILNSRNKLKGLQDELNTRIDKGSLLKLKERTLDRQLLAVQNDRNNFLDDTLKLAENDIKQTQIKIKLNQNSVAQDKLTLESKYALLSANQAFADSEGNTHSLLKTQKQLKLELAQATEKHTNAMVDETAVASAAMIAIQAKINDNAKAIEEAQTLTAHAVESSFLKQLEAEKAWFRQSSPAQKKSAQLSIRKRQLVELEKKGIIDKWELEKRKAAWDADNAENEQNIHAERVKQAEMLVQAYGNFVSALEDMMDARANKNKKDELEDAKSIRNTRVRESTIAGINDKYDKEAEDRAKAMFALNILEAISNTGLAVTQALATPFVPMNFVLAGLAAATGAAQVVTMTANTFEEGGMVGGRRHSEGGTMIEAERGEFVISRRGVDAIGVENLNRMNNGGSGSVNVTFSGNVLSQDFIENDAIPQIRDAIRRGADIGVS